MSRAGIGLRLADRLGEDLVGGLDPGERSGAVGGLHRPIAVDLLTVYQGNVPASVVRIGELFRDAVRRNANGLILVHNHPSGDPTPSPDDLHLTAEAVAAGRLLDAYVSLRDRGVAFADR